MVKLTVAATLAFAAIAAAVPLDSIPKVRVHNRRGNQSFRAMPTATAQATAAAPEYTGSAAASVEPSAGTWSTATAEPAADTTGAASTGTASSAGSAAYKQYSGTGAESEGWPSEGDWVSWDAMLAANKAVMGTCAGGQVKNSADETADVISAIESVAESSGVDKRFILATVMQESNGCVRVQTTNYGVRNPGLMQDHDGEGTCNDGTVQNPCPSSEISQMIQDGAAGTTAGDGLKQVLASVKTTYGYSGAQQVYAAARSYNSGSLASNKKLECGIATHCYSSDIANRLMGFTGDSACTYDKDDATC